MQRREFFAQLFTPKRPKEEVRFPFAPYYKNEADFEKCKECENKSCVTACEESIIVIQDNKPVLDFSKSGCTFCDACAEACEMGVLKKEHKRTLPSLTIDILGCLAWQKTICSMCKDVCLDSAIRFTGLFNPEISDDCTGCGFCVSVCPTGAIKIGGVA